MLVYVTDLLGHSTLPAFHDVILHLLYFFLHSPYTFHRKSQPINLFLIAKAIKHVNISPTQTAAGLPYPCPQFNCIVLRQTQPRTTMAMAIQQMTKLREVSNPSYLPDTLNTIIMFLHERRK